MVPHLKHAAAEYLSTATTCIDRQSNICSKSLDLVTCRQLCGAFALQGSPQVSLRFARLALDVLAPLKQMDAYAQFRCHHVPFRIIGA